MGDSGIRQRKKKSQKLERKQETVSLTREPLINQDEDSATILWILWNCSRTISGVLGLLAMMVMGYQYALYCGLLLDNHLWFSNIKEVEREISFRTESGLYYSYYKQMVNARTLEQGMYELTHDNLTEHTSTMNVLQRMNIYQEVGLAVLYRTYVKPYFPHIEAVYFYLYSIFSLHGALLGALYIMTWMMSGSWLTGALAAALYVANKEDTTRVAYVVPLRESFSLPFLWLQIAFISIYFSAKSKGKLKPALCGFGILLNTFLFALFWQFNQFILLLQAMALFGVQVLQMVPHHKILVVYCIQLLSLFAVCVLQYWNTMLLTGPLFSFVPAAILLMFVQGENPSASSILSRTLKVVGYIILVFILAFGMSLITKMIWPQEADEHIFKFVLSKFGIAAATRDFDVQLYLCNGAFTFLASDAFVRLSKLIVFPLYVVYHVGLLAMLAWALLQKWKKENMPQKKTDSETSPNDRQHAFSSRPQLAYHTIQMFFFGLLGVAVTRMKYVWTPYMCVAAAMLVGDFTLWKILVIKLGSRSKMLIIILQNLSVICVMGLLVYLYVPTYKQEMENLREFYDPDTVELMEWIKKSTPHGAAFAGSMQLLAGVKLCTGRPITNHPHYEDKALRIRTRELLQMYARTKAADVHRILRKYDASYVILEDSICLSPRKDRCRTPDIMDVYNGVLPDYVDKEEGLVRSNVPRFCDEIRHGKPPYNKYFRLAFQNKTFRVYYVLIV